MGAKTVEETFAAPPDQVFAALQGAAQQVAKSFQGVDQANRTVKFNTGTSMSSWTGQDVTASVADDGAGGSHVTVDVRLAKRGMSSIQLFDWGESKRVANKLLQAVRAQLGTPA